MKKTFLFNLLVIIFISGLYFLPDMIDKIFSHHRLSAFRAGKDTIILLVDSISVLGWVLFLLSVTYKYHWDLGVLRTAKKGITFGLLVLSSIFVIVKGYGFLRQIDKLYEFYKGHQIIKGNVFEADSILGHRGVASGQGFYSYNIGNGVKQIPIILDSSGFRTHSLYRNAQPDSLVVFLGCSFTWGDFCVADKTYPFYIAQKYNYSYVNMGTSAYGLAQMAVLAERNIPKLKPKIVFVQHSPWLANRARCIFYPSAFGIMPFPYIYTKDEQYEIAKPLFSSSLYDSSALYFKKSTKSFKDKCQFFWKVGLPVVVIDYFKYKWAILKISIKMEPNSVATNAAAEAFVYDKINKICQANGAKLVILNVGGMGYDEQRFNNHYDRRYFRQNNPNLKNNLFIDVDSVLRMTTKTAKEYEKYLLWDSIGTNKVMFDVHPNGDTHKKMAEIVISKLRSK